MERGATLNYDKLVEIEEKLLDEAYIYGVEKANNEITNARELYEKNIGSLTGFDKWSIFNAESGQMSILEIYIKSRQGLSEENMGVLKAWMKSEMKVCEAIETSSGESITCRDIISGEKLMIESGGMLKKGDIFIGRVFLLDQIFYVSRILSVFVDKKLAETVKGKFREAYESYCNIRGYVTYENYAQKNQWMFYKMIEIIDKIERVQEEKILEVHSAVYIVPDRERLMGKIRKTDAFIPDDSDAGVEYYLLLEGSDLLCEVEVHGDRIVINGNSLEELKKSQAKVEKIFASDIVFSESHTKKLEDLIE
jgi:hypothetical protein